MRLIDENELINGRVENDPVAIAAKCAPTAYDFNEVIANLEEYFAENELEENSGFIEVCIDIVKDGMTAPDTECREKSKLDTIVEQLQKVSYERFGNVGMGGEFVVNLEDAIEIVRGVADES